ncbi:MAG TPA: hypothetical protein VFM38_04165 [Candidatus Limnocylindrales bacterium]|nr:hypothetical protein [Candidatus Limnocylindrales bacterium]
MVAGLVRFVIFRVFGARVLLALSALGWIWSRLRGRRSGDEPRRVAATTRRRT